MSVNKISTTTPEAFAQHLKDNLPHGFDMSNVAVITAEEVNALNAVSPQNNNENRLKGGDFKMK